MPPLFMRYQFNDNITMNHSQNIPNDDFSVHIHDVYEIYYFLSGDVTYLIEGSAYQLRPHDILLINSGELHRPVFNSNASYERMVIHFQPEYISPFQTKEYNLLYCFERRKLGQYNLLSGSDIQNSLIPDLFTSISRTSPLQTPESDLLIKTYFVQLLVELNNIFSKQKTAEIPAAYDDKIVGILHYLNENLAENISLDELEKRFFISKYYLCHLFKKNTGITIGDYIAHKRILKAKELLMLKMPLSEVAHLIGYEDYSTFYRTFKRIIGISPKEYLSI